MSGQERLPGRLRAALGSGLDAVVPEDSLDRVAGDFVAEAVQAAADSRVASGGVLGRQADHRSTSAAMSGLVLGRPGARFLEPAYFWATSWRHQRRIVPG
jgi:hypothetical protein